MDNKISGKTIGVVIAIVIAVFLLYTYSQQTQQNSRDRQAQYQAQSNSQTEHLTSSFKNPGEMLTDSEKLDEDLLMDYERKYDDWISAEGQLHIWLESGQQYPQCRESIIEWANQILAFPAYKVPDSYKSTHDQLASRAMQLRASVY